MTLIIIYHAQKIWTVVYNLRQFNPSMSTHPIYLGSTLIIYSYLPLSLSRGDFSWGDANFTFLWHGLTSLDLYFQHMSIEVNETRARRLSMSKKDAGFQQR